MARRLNAYERRKADRALKRRVRYREERDQRLFQRLLDETANEQRLKDAREHEKDHCGDN